MSVICSAPSRPLRASCSESCVKPEMSTNTAVPSALHARPPGASARCCWSVRGTYGRTRWASSGNAAAGLLRVAAALSPWAGVDSGSEIIVAIARRPMILTRASLGRACCPAGSPWRANARVRTRRPACAANHAGSRAGGDNQRLRARGKQRERQAGEELRQGEASRAIVYAGPGQDVVPGGPLERGSVDRRIAPCAGAERQYRLSADESANEARHDDHGVIVAAHACERAHVAGALAGHGKRDVRAVTEQRFPVAPQFERAPGQELLEATVFHVAHQVDREPGERPGRRGA